MWDESGKLYPLLGAKPNQNDLAWRFPSGARLSFGHLQHEKTKQDYQGAQIPLIGWDQLEHFTESQFFYMLSRNRSTCGVRPYIRATVNPDADSWVADFIDWWINQDTGFAINERAGVLRWFVRLGETLTWSSSREWLEEKYPNLKPKSLTFIPASVYDNKILLAKDPGYLANLMALPLVDRERLLGGNWKIKPAAGKVFNEAWFEIVDAVPAGGVECRFWDFAGTAKKMAGDDPDFTASTKIRKVNGVYYVTDSTAVQEGPAEVETQFVNTSWHDASESKESGAQYLVRWEVEPGSAAKRDELRLVQMLAGLDAAGESPQGDKIVRAKPLAAQAQVGNVKLLRGPWNKMWLKHMHSQPDAKHDDIMDASSGAFTAVVTAGVEYGPSLWN